MAEQQYNSTRWKAAAVDANAQFLEERWQTIVQQWREASEAYRSIYQSEVPDMNQLRRLSRHLYELGQEKTALKYALGA